MSPESRDGMGPAWVALVCPMAQERWHSIDLVAEMLRSQLAARHGREVRAELIRPALPARFERLPPWVRGARNADRLVNRFWGYPRYLRRVRSGFDLFHLVEHSYGQLARELPAERTLVTLHDLDTFRCFLEPERDPRPRWYQAMARRQMTALRTAARVICVSHTVAEELRGFGIVAAGRIRVVPNGIDPACSPVADPVADAEADRLLGPRAGVELLHVGSTVPRKRIDVLLRVLASVRREIRGARLLRAGGALTAEQRELARGLGVADAVVTLPFVDRATLAAVYRRATLVLQTSDAEGFGLPVAEAMACGTPVVGSDLPVLREVGGAAAVYRPVGDVPAWSEAVLSLLTERRERPDRWAARVDAGVARGSAFSWEENARSTVEIYRELLGG